MDPDILREKLSQNLSFKNMLLTRIYGMTPLPFDSMYQEALEWGAKLAPYMGDSPWRCRRLGTKEEVCFSKVLKELFWMWISAPIPT